MKLTSTDIPGVFIVEPSVFSDNRGWFMETFNEPGFHSALARLGQPVPRPFIQDNHSCSRAGVLRGLHYQLFPHSQGKLVRVTQGAAWDVAVDIRPDSSCYGHWVGVELTSENKRQLWIPEGFAHGFLALQDETHFSYKTTDVYAKEFERSIIWNDDVLAIDWPVARVGGFVMVSDKDSGASPFRK